MPQRIRLQRLRQCPAEEGVRRLDEDWADVNTAVADDATVLADQLARVKSLHHLWANALLGTVAALPLGLGPDTQRWQYLEPRPVVAVRLQHGEEAVDQLGLVLVVVRARD